MTTNGTDQFGGYKEVPSSEEEYKDAPVGVEQRSDLIKQQWEENVKNANKSPFRTPIVDAPPTGHALALRVINMLAENRDLVETVSVTKAKNGSYHVTFMTYPEEIEK